MTNDELLLGISKIIDVKLDPIKEDIRSLKADVNELKGDVAVLKADVNELKEDVAVLKADVNELKEDVAVLKTDVNELKRNHTALEKKFDDLRGEVISIKLFQENELLPRLRTIEACYISTYKRYAGGIEKLDTLRSDVDVLQTVVENHSARIQNLENLQPA